jgi:hypothetical protein
MISSTCLDNRSSLDVPLDNKSLIAAFSGEGHSQLARQSTRLSANASQGNETP